MVFQIRPPIWNDLLSTFLLYALATRALSLSNSLLDLVRQLAEHNIERSWATSFHVVRQTRALLLTPWSIVRVWETESMNNMLSDKIDDLPMCHIFNGTTLCHFVKSVKTNMKWCSFKEMRWIWPTRSSSYRKCILAKWWLGKSPWGRISMMITIKKLANQMLQNILCLWIIVVIYM